LQIQRRIIIPAKTAE